MMMNRLILILFTFLTISSFAQETSTDSITENGKRLINLLENSHIEELWQKGYRINWETGASICPSKKSTSTHCSAFAASFAKKVGIYLLCPPQHETHLLANAQYDWLQTKEAAKEGWVQLKKAVEAQNHANKGELVVAVYKNEDETKPGHIAIIRPSIKSNKQLEEEGPQITQAGAINYYSISLKVGFKHHLKACPNGVRYYKNKIKWDELER